MKPKLEKDTVIGVLKNKRDLSIAIHDKWYRIPVKSAPVIVRNNKIKYLALYQGKKVFKDSPGQIQWYGEVRNITIHKRIELLPEEKNNSNANADYYKIELAEMIKLHEPIKAVSPKRINFIITTFDRFIKAKELNDLFFENDIEEKVWDDLISPGFSPW